MFHNHHNLLSVNILLCRQTENRTATKKTERSVRRDLQESDGRKRSMSLRVYHTTNYWMNSSRGPGERLKRCEVCLPAELQPVNCLKQTLPKLLCQFPNARH